MKRLSLLRHAKAVPQESGLEDFDRPLAERGRREAPLIGRHLRETGLVPDLVISSPSARTRETTTLVLAELGEPRPHLIHERRIYEAEPGTLLEVVREAPESAPHIMLIGHNPGFQQLALLLAMTPLAPEHEELRANLPTSGCVTLDIPAARWAAVGAGTAAVVHLVTPRRLRPGG